MIEEIILNYLQAKLGLPVFLEEHDIDTYLLIGKSGTSRKNHLDSAVIYIQSYAQSKYEASLLNEKVKKVMDEIIELDSISSSELNTDYEYTDTNKKKYRYQAVYDLVFYT